MLVISSRIAQSAAFLFKLNVRLITTQQVLYEPWSVSISGSKSVSCSVSSSSSKNSAQASSVCEYVYPAGTLTISDGRAPEVLPVREGGVPGIGGVGCGVRTLRRVGGGVPIALGLQRVCGFFPVPFWQGRQPDVWLWRSIAGSLCIAAFTFVYPETQNPDSSLLGPRRIVS